MRERTGPISGAVSVRPGGAGSIGGHTVSRIGYGAMELSSLADDQPKAVALVRQALELGVDHIDTAEFYGNGLVNQILRAALHPEDDVLLVSKIGADPNPEGGMQLAQQPDQIRASVENHRSASGSSRSA